MSTFNEMVLWFLSAIALCFIVGGIFVGMLALHDADLSLGLRCCAAIIAAGILWTLTKIAANKSA